MKDQTLAIHAGFKSDPETKAVVVPVYQTVAYEFDNAQHGADLFIKEDAKRALGKEKISDKIFEIERRLLEKRRPA